MMKIKKFKQLFPFFKGKRVLITGNTGFKGSWLTHILLSAGAEVTGYALNPPTEPNLFTIAGLEYNSNLNQVTADVRDLNKLLEVFKATKPEIVFHLAAQPIVRDSFKDPVNTYDTNVMGTVNICEAIRQTSSVQSFLNVTTDKVYKNVEWEYGYREIDELDGFDPYSNSKSCSELITHSYKNSFFQDSGVCVSTARAGNVIGGGDFANDRIIPDCVRALQSVRNGEGKAVISVRNPYSTRPYEHVLEPLFTYMLIVKAQYEDKKYSGCYNVGPDDIDCVETGNLVSIFCDFWNEQGSEIILSWENKAQFDAPHEANFLKLDCSKLKSTFGWKPVWHIREAIRKTVEFTKVWLDGGDEISIRTEMDREIEEFTQM